MKNVHHKNQIGLLPSMTHILVFTALIIFMMSSCKKDETLTPTQVNAGAQSQALTAKWGPPNITVHKGESIQAAVDKATSNAVIFIEPGTYKEAVVVDKPGIKLIGEISVNGNVIIKNPGSAKNGIKVSDNGDGFVLANVTVRDFDENGVSLENTDNYVISNVTALNNKQYGISVSHSANGIIEFCKAKGSSDTGIHIEESSSAEVISNLASGNVTGIEVSNSSDVEVKLNESYNNVAGILVSLLPGRDIKTSSNVHVLQNKIYNNNHVNFATDTTQLESNIPVGIGVLVLGTDQTVIENNTINNNDFSGVIVFTSLVLIQLADVDPGEYAGMEPNPDGVRIRNNSLKHNGKNPPVIPGIPLPGADLIYDGSGTGNCWSNNTFKTSYPSPLPSCN
ncbi:MAG TPA: parallel beta-helix domain-containing protein [Parafilimonas sp.]|nr:parallel beta-helix domain-containing protein [Parafilimonas sp.]